MTIREWALLALAVIAGVPLYATIAGLTARAMDGRRISHWLHDGRLDKWGVSACPHYWTGEREIRRYGQGPCDCDAHKRAGWLWPVVLVWTAVEATGRALLLLPARAAYRAALRGGREP